MQQIRQPLSAAEHFRRDSAAARQRQFSRVALINNPNSGKSSLFNQHTGLNQKVGHFPGVRVDRKTGVS